MIQRIRIGIIVLITLSAGATGQTLPTTVPTTQPAGGAVRALAGGGGSSHAETRSFRQQRICCAGRSMAGSRVGSSSIRGRRASMIDETTASKLHLRVLNGMQMQAAGNLHTAVQAVAVRSLALTSAAAAEGQVVMNGGFVVSKDLQAVSAVEGIPIAGAIGNDILSIPFALDFRDDTITFYAHDHFSPPSTRPSEIRMYNQTPLVTGQFEGHQGWFLVDTGDSGRFEVQGFALSML